MQVVKRCVFHYYCWYSKQFEVALTISYHKTKNYVSTTYNFWIFKSDNCWFEDKFKNFCCRCFVLYIQKFMYFFLRIRLPIFLMKKKRINAFFSYTLCCSTSKSSKKYYRTLWNSPFTEPWSSLKSFAI